MQQIQPINEWFGINPVRKPKPPVMDTTRLKDDLDAALQAKADREAARYEPPEGINPDEEWFRHHNWKDKRKVVAQALIEAGTSESATLNFNNCGACCQVEWSESKKRYRVIGSYCHCRHCEPCMKAKSSLIIKNLREKMKDAKQSTYHFITLTLAHDPTKTLKEQIQRLYACYKRLRQTDEWIYGQINADRIFLASGKGVKHTEAIKHVSKKGQKGGAATLEIKFTEAGNRVAKDGSTYFYEGGWHPHLHIISEGTMITDHRLKDLWFHITGDSWECDCRKISADKDVAYYVGKYVTKGTNDEVWKHPARAAEFVRAVKGVRMCATFGSWRGYKLLQREKEEPGEWTHVASLASLVRRMNAGEEHARRLLIVLCESLSYDPHRKRQPKPS
jgi:hypothetical protein